MREVMLYHPDRDPDGTCFDLDKHDKNILAEQGWCDCPIKAGFDPWNRERQDIVRQRKEAVERGEVPRIGREPTPDERDRALAEQKKSERFQKELDAALEALRVQEDENARLKRALAEDKERFADETSDANKIREKTAGKAAAQAADRKKAADKAAKTEPEAPSEPTEGAPLEL